MNTLADNLAENPTGKRLMERAEQGDLLVYRLLVAVDIQGYSKRDAREQLLAQQDLSDLLDEAAAGAGLNRSTWGKQVGGDGELALLPGGTDLAAVVGDFPLLLAAGLRALNRERSGRPRLRVRLAVHHGTLTAGPFGPAGDAPVVVQRLLDAAPLRRLLHDDPDRDLAYAVSASLYEDVVRSGFPRLEPRDFRAVRITAKGTDYRGHIHVGDPAAFADLGELQALPTSAPPPAVR